MFSFFAIYLFFPDPLTESNSAATYTIGKSFDDYAIRPRRLLRPGRYCPVLGFMCPQLGRPPFLVFVRLSFATVTADTALPKACAKVGVPARLIS